VSAAYRAAAKFHHSRADPVRGKHVKTDGGSHNVDNRIQRADLVKRNLVNRNSVYPGFGFRDPRKNIQRAFFRPFLYGRIFNNAADVFPVPVMVMIHGMVFMFVIMSVIVFVIMFVRIVMAMPVTAIIGIVMVIFTMFVMTFMMMFVMIIIMFTILIVFAKSFNFYQSSGSGNAASFIADKLKLPSAQVEFFQLREKQRRIRSQIHKGAKGHVAGNTGKAVKMQSLHRHAPYDVFTDPPAELIVASGGLFHRVTNGYPAFSGVVWIARFRLPLL
jgi:hypothetical protein